MNLLNVPKVNNKDFRTILNSVVLSPSPLALNIFSTLTHFKPMFYFLYPLKISENKFSGGIEREHCLEMG